MLEGLARADVPRSARYGKNLTQMQLLFATDNIEHGVGFQLPCSVSYRGEVGGHVGEAPVGLLHYSGQWPVVFADELIQEYAPGTIALDEKALVGEFVDNQGQIIVVCAFRPDVADTE